MWLLNHAHYCAAVTASTPLGRLSTRSWWDCSHLTRRASVRSPTDVGWWGQMCQMGSRSGLFTHASITNHEHGSHFPKSVIKWNWLGVVDATGILRKLWPQSLNHENSSRLKVHKWCVSAIIPLDIRWIGCRCFYTDVIESLNGRSCHLIEIHVYTYLRFKKDTLTTI